MLTFAARFTGGGRRARSQKIKVLLLACFFKKGFYLCTPLRYESGLGGWKRRKRKSFFAFGVATEGIAFVSLQPASLGRGSAKGKVKKFFRSGILPGK